MQIRVILTLQLSRCQPFSFAYLLYVSLRILLRFWIDKFQKISKHLSVRYLSMFVALLNEFLKWISPRNNGDFEFKL